MMTMTNNTTNSNNKATSPTLSSILNKKSTTTTTSTATATPMIIDTPMKEYLPTPVTPAAASASLDFSQFHNSISNNKKDTSSSSSSSGYSTFSVIKPPSGSSPSASSINNNTNSSPTTNINTTPATTTNDTTANNTSKPYPCPECHQTFSRPHNLKSHLTTHSSERPFQVKTIIRKLISYIKFLWVACSCTRILNSNFPYSVMYVIIILEDIMI